EVATAIRGEHRNPDYLGELDLPAALTATTDPRAAAEGADLVVLAVPSQSLRENLAVWGDTIPADAPVVSLMKGIELGTGLRMSEVMVASGLDPAQVVVVSGPNLSKEIAARQPAATVVAGADLAAAEQVATRAEL